MHTVVAFMTLEALFSEADGEGKEHVLHEPSNPNPNPNPTLTLTLTLTVP